MEQATCLEVPMVVGSMVVYKDRVWELKFLNFSDGGVNLYHMLWDGADRAKALASEVRLATEEEVEKWKQDKVAPKVDKDYVWYMGETAQAILAEFLRLGNATVKELEGLTHAHPATISRTIRLARRYGHTVVYSSDDDGGNRFYVDHQGLIPKNSGQGVNCVNGTNVLTWLSKNPGYWFDAQIAEGLGLDSNKHESIGAAVRLLLQQGKINKQYIGKLRQVSSKEISNG